jgi:transposase
MFGFGAATRIYVATGSIDMRKGFNGLYGIVRNRFAMDPESGHLFLFSNAKRDRMKVLFFDLCWLAINVKCLHFMPTNKGGIQE